MNLDLRKYSTFNLGGVALGVQQIQNENDVLKANTFAQRNNQHLIIIGEGSNTIFGDSKGVYIIGKMDITGIEVIADTDSEVTVRVGAGEIWDEFVQWSVDHNFSGIEALSAIPGTVGAGPVQNIGAYGTEISDVIVSVKALNRLTNTFEELSKQACCFSYRDAIFKRNPQKYIITSVTVTLSKKPPQIPQHAKILDWFEEKTPTGAELRDEIIRIRNSKLPNHKELANCGCFFINPIVSKTLLETIKSNHPDVPFFETNEALYKIYAGWLIEKIDYQRIQTQDFYFYPKNKLVLVHSGFGRFEEFTEVVSGVIQSVKTEFGVTLEPEPNMYP